MHAKISIDLRYDRADAINSKDTIKVDAAIYANKINFELVTIFIAPVCLKRSKLTLNYSLCMLIALFYSLLKLNTILSALLLIAYSLRTTTQYCLSVCFLNIFLCKCDY